MTTKAPKVLIGGGKGFIGSVLKQLLDKEGYDAKIVSRTAVRDGYTYTDLNLMGIPENTVAVVNLAGEPVLDPLKRWNDTFKEIVIGSRINPTGFFRELIKDSPKKPKIFVSISGVGIYKPDEHKDYDENTEIKEGFDFISKLAIDWENTAKLDIEGVRQVILRSGVVLGRTGGMIKQVFPTFYMGFGGRIGTGQQYFPWIHVHDTCRLILFAIENEKVNGILNGVAPQIITNAQFTKAFARALIRPAFFPVPAFVMKKLLGEERAIMVLEGQKVHPKRVLDYGFSYLYPQIDDACKEFSKLLYLRPDIPGIKTTKH